MFMIFATSTAFAQTSRIYFAGYMGLSTHKEDDFSESTTASSGDYELDNGFALAAALGLRLTPEWRVEAEISRTTADFDRTDLTTGSFAIGGEIETWLYLLSAYYDFDWTWKNFQPFLSVGIGFAGNETQISDSQAGLPNASDDALGFAWSLGGGLKYRVEPDMAITSNYRYIGTSDVEADSYDFGYSAHEFRLGMEYDLPTEWFIRD